MPSMPMPSQPSYPMSEKSYSPYGGPPPPGPGYGAPPPGQGYGAPPPPGQGYGAPPPGPVVVEPHKEKKKKFGGDLGKTVSLTTLSML